MLSATTAERRLSRAASSATVRAEGIRGTIKSGRNAGSERCGKPVGIPPKALPMVATPSEKNATHAVATTTATIDPGIRRVSRGMTRISASEAEDNAIVGHWIVEMFAASTLIRARNSLGTEVI